MKQSSYVLITPVKDEECLIGQTIDSVIAQTVLPLQWVIVNDGSTDRTENIVRHAASKHPWINLVCLPPRNYRSFAAVVDATETGVKSLTMTGYKYIGLLDSDVRFKPDYFEKLIKYFETNPRLGLAGGVVVDIEQKKKSIPINLVDVPGASQFFRRKCYDELCGLLAIPEGGWDMLTCARARMLGYETRLFTDLVIDHLKPRNVSEGGLLRRTFQMGQRDFALGYQPIFEIFKCISRLVEPPPILGAVARFAGYWMHFLKGNRRLVPKDLLCFIHSEQLVRLKQTLRLQKHT